MESDVITLQDLFRFEVEGFASDRSVIGSLNATGLRPTFTGKFEKRGVQLPGDLFVPPAAHELHLAGRGGAQ
jgi:pilus assembly protein CpaF